MSWVQMLSVADFFNVSKWLVLKNIYKCALSGMGTPLDDGSLWLACCQSNKEHNRAANISLNSDSIQDQHPHTGEILNTNAASWYCGPY